MKSHVVFVSLIAAAAFQSPAFAQSASEPVTQKHAVAPTAAPASANTASDAAPAAIAAPEKGKSKAKRHQAVAAPTPAPAYEPSSMERFNNFFRGGSATDMGTSRPA